MSKRGNAADRRQASRTGAWEFAPGKRLPNPDGWVIPNVPSALAMERWYYVDRIGRARCRPGFRLERREGDMHLLHVMLKGELEHEIRNRRHPVREGEACLMDMAEPASHENRGKRLAELYWVSFRGPDLDKWFELLHAGREPVFRGVDRAAMIRLFRELIRLTERRPAGYEPRASMLLAGLLAELYAARERADPLLSWNREWKALSPPILAAIQIMFIEHSSPMDVRHVAEYAKLSPGRFAHRFRREVGLSPMAWLARFRIQRAQALLAGVDRPIAEVGRTVGLPEPAHFARLFRRLMGQSPRRYRRGLASRKTKPAAGSN